MILFLGMVAGNIDLFVLLFMAYLYILPSSTGSLLLSCAVFMASTKLILLIVKLLICRLLDKQTWSVFIEL